MNPPLVSIGQTAMGRGVFANKSFAKDEIIEVAPTITDCGNEFTGRMDDYWFSSSYKPKCKVVAFGYASMYNHKNNPTAKWTVKENDTMEIKALEDISKGDEIYISYGDNYWKSRGIKPK